MLDLLNFHKIEVLPTRPSSPNEQYKGTCPFCGSEKFFVNVSKQAWDCKPCAVAGNQYTLLTMLHDRSLQKTTDAHLQGLCSKRKGITSASLKAAQFAWDDSNRRWLVPYQNGSEFLNNLGAFKPDIGFRIFKSPGMALKLYRPTNPKTLEENVIIVEGEWDLLAFLPHLPEGYSIVAVPGAMTFKPEFIPAFQDRYVHLVYDRDDAGKSGISKAVRLLGPVAKGINYLQWPDEFHFPSADDSTKPGKDVRDLVSHLS